MAQRRRTTSWRDRFRRPDTTNLYVGIAGLILVMVIVLPRVYPAARQGPTCSDLAAPIGGNNRSVLAQAGNDQQSLDLDLSLDEDIISTNDSLNIKLTFINRDIGPVILFLTGQDPPLSRTAGAIGIEFEITPITSTIPLTDTITQSTPQIVAFRREVLHLLGSRSRCTQEYDISPTLLQQMGLIPGEYRIRAYYYNGDAGTQATPVFGATATPAYPNNLPDPGNIQGVWTGEVASEEIRFSVVAPGSVPTG